MPPSEPKPRKRTKHKPSDLTTEEVSNVVSLLKNLVADLDDEDEDGQIVIESVQNVIRKLSQDTHLSFSDLTLNSLVNTQITLRPLKWKTTGQDEATELRNNLIDGAVTVEETKKNLCNIHKIVSMETEAGCRMVINVMLLHAALNLDSAENGVAIAPEFRIDDTRLEPTGYTYGGVINYMIIFTDRSTRDLMVQSPKLAFLSEAVRKLLSCNIYEAKAKSDAVMTALPQAAMAAAVKAKQLGLDTFRGCVATSQEWLFFIYSCSDVGGKISFMQPLELEKDFSNLSLILGLLRDWIENGHKKELRFCADFMD
ncbi:hypothetical protein B0H10DRAFT_2206580 [Mycena sp. CBHHK59/15]|nr:hypothetical protein B0H10DRAFT_2206580 [Mycena sp. CBHHK59/15]